jgi:hypothetical protein
MYLYLTSFVPSYTLFYLHTFLRYNFLSKIHTTFRTYQCFSETLVSTYLLNPHGVTTQKTNTEIFTALITSNLIKEIWPNHFDKIFFLYKEVDNKCYMGLSKSNGMETESIFSTTNICICSMYSLFKKYMGYGTNFPCVCARTLPSFQRMVTQPAVNQHGVTDIVAPHQLRKFYSAD